MLNKKAPEPPSYAGTDDHDETAAAAPVVYDAGDATLNSYATKQMLSPLATYLFTSKQ